MSNASVTQGSGRGKVIASALRNSHVLFARFFPGFTDANYLSTAQHLPNHLAWTLGHLSLVLNYCAGKLNGQPLPAGDFDPGMGSATTIGTQAVSVGSNPLVDKATYPPLSRCLEIFAASIEHIASAYEVASDEKLDELTPWGNTQTSLEQLGLRMVFHNGVHCGQITDLRRALGMDYVIGKPRGA
jgi:hypothetical protein